METLLDSQGFVEKQARLGDVLALSMYRFLTQMYARFWNDLADHASA